MDTSDRPLCSAGTVNRANQVGRKLLVAWCVRGCSGAVWSAGVFFLFFVFVLISGFARTRPKLYCNIFFFFSFIIKNPKAVCLPRLSTTVIYLYLQKKMRGCEIEWKNKYIGAQRFPHSAVACSGFYFRKVIYRVPENTANIWNLFPVNQSSKDI